MNKNYLILWFCVFIALNVKAVMAYDCRGLHTYADSASYYKGDKVKNNENAYECLVAGWCTQGGPFAPGDGWASDHAWKHLGECTDPVVPNKIPIIDFHGPYATLPGGSVSFDGESISRDPDGTIVKYEWDFGHGDISNEANPTRSYQQVGLHPFTFTVTDDDGAINYSNTSVMVSIEPNAECPAQRWFKEEAYIVGEVVQNGGVDYRCINGVCGYPPTAPQPGGVRAWEHAWVSLGDCTLNNDYNTLPDAKVTGPANAELDEEISFDSSGSVDPDGTIISYDWDFGDGNTSTDQHPSHTYRTDGRHFVRLVVTDNDGGTDSAGMYVTVKRPNNPDCWAPIWFSGMKIEKNDVVQNNGRDYRCMTDIYCSVFSIEPGAPGTSGIFKDLGICSIDPPPPPPLTCADLTPDYEDGTYYAAGDEVEYIRRKFRCDISGWCSTGGWAFRPGSGAHWEMAWTDLGECL